MSFRVSSTSTSRRVSNRPNRCRSSISSRTTMATRRLVRVKNASPTIVVPRNDPSRVIPTKVPTIQISNVTRRSCSRTNAADRRRNTAIRTTIINTTRFTIVTTTTAAKVSWSKTTTRHKGTNSSTRSRIFSVRTRQKRVCPFDDYRRETCQSMSRPVSVDVVRDFTPSFFSR